MKINKWSIGEKLKKCRKERKLTQKEIADILEIHQVTYLGYEKNKHEPSLEILLKIADYYNVSTDYLLGRYDKKESN